LRNGLLRFLQAVSASFELVLYTSTDREIAGLIADYMEDLCSIGSGGAGQPLFSGGRFFSQDCKRPTTPGDEHLRLRNIQGLVMDESRPWRSETNVVAIGVGYEEMANNIRNYVPVKAFEGKKRDHVLKYLQEYLVGKVAPAPDARLLLTQDFISQVKIRKYHKLTL
jgi:hypothetical protein